MPNEARKEGKGRAGATVIDDPQPMASFYRDHWNDLVAWLYARYGAGPPEPEDVAQAAFSKIMAHESPEEIREPRAFLWRIAQNIVISEKRRSRTRHIHAEQEIRHLLEMPGDDLTAERVVIAKEQMALIVAVLEKMPKRRRRMLVLHRVHGLSQAEVARRMFRSASAVKKQIAIGLQALHDALNSEEPVIENVARQKGKRKP